MSAPHGRIRLLLVDDHPVVRDGLRGVFADDADFEVVGEAANGAEAVARVERTGADVVLMDLRMPEMGGVEAIRRLRERAPSVRVLVLTTYDTDSDVLPVLSPAVARRLMGRVRKPAPAEDLSQRELDVLRLVADGATNAEAPPSCS
jgi:DNA-binding NarL/FixJ family response regulator